MNMCETLAGMHGFLEFTDYWPTYAEPYPHAPSDEKGLRNYYGENNCFLNVVIQALWHLDAFRQKFNSHLAENNHHHGDPCVFCSLQSIFTQYEFSDEKVIPPTALRQTMAILFKAQSKFQLFELDDASEAFEAVLSCLHDQFFDTRKGLTPVNEECKSKHCIPHQVFGMNTKEQLVCDACGATTKPTKTTLFTVFAYAAALRQMFQQNPADSFCKLLHKASEDWRPCANRGHCNKMCKMVHILTSVPEVFAVSVVWDTPNSTAEEIEMALNMISVRVNIGNVFKLQAKTDTGMKNSCWYRLRGMICYYGKHYTAYFYSYQAAQWFVFDDITVRPLGIDWPTIREKCMRGKLQPSTLFYECEETVTPAPLAESLIMSALNLKQPKFDELPITKIHTSNHTSNPMPPSLTDVTLTQTASQITPTIPTPLSESNFHPSVGITVTPVTPDHSLDSPASNSTNASQMIEVDLRPTEPTLVVTNPVTTSNANSSSGNSAGSQIKISKIHTDLESQIETTKNEPEEAKTVTTEASFVLVPSNNDTDSEQEFVVTRTNWMYRRQIRVYRFKQDCFMRLEPDHGAMRESWSYTDVFDVTITDAFNMVLRFYSGKEAQYIQSKSNQEILDLLVRRAKVYGHTFPIRKAT